MKIYKDFVEFYETAVKNLYIMKQQRLDGKEKGSNSKEFARFRYRYKTWKVNQDTNVAKKWDPLFFPNPGRFEKFGATCGRPNFAQQRLGLG